MIRIILLLILSLPLFSQTIVSDSFNSFVRTDTNAVASYLFDTESASGQINTDQAVGGFDLLFSTFGVSYTNLTDDLVSGSPIYSGGYGLAFNGTSEYLEHSATEDTFDLKLSDVTISVWFKTSATVANQFFIDKRTNYTNTGYGIFTSGTGQIRALISPSNTVFTQLTGVVLSANTNYCLTVTFDRDGDASLFLNRQTPVTSSISAYSASNINTASNFTIGANSFATRVYSDFTIYSVKFYKELKTQQWHNEQYALADNWISANGNVTKESSTDFFQTAFSDTLLLPLSDATLGANQEWKFTLSNKDTVTAWIGSKILAKSNVRTIAGGAAFTSNTEYWSDFTSLSGDSLVIVFPADTASVDNIVLKKESHHLIRNVNRWITW